MTTTHNPSDARMTAQAPYESQLVAKAIESLKQKSVDWRFKYCADMRYGLSDYQCGQHDAVDEIMDALDSQLDALTAAVAALPERAPVSAGGDAEPRFFVDHGMVHDRKTGKHLVGCNYAGETPEALIAVLRELENDRDAWRLTAKTLDATPASPVGADWVVVPREVAHTAAKRLRLGVTGNVTAGLLEQALAAPTPAEARGVGDERWPATDPGYTRVFNAICAATRPEWGGKATAVSVESFMSALAANKPAGEDDGVRVATPEEEAEIDRAAGLVKLVLRLPSELHARLDSEAKAYGCVLPAFIRHLLGESTDTRQAQAQGSEGVGNG